jgi:hypothetical protein
MISKALNQTGAIKKAFYKIYAVSVSVIKLREEFPQKRGLNINEEKNGTIYRININTAHDIFYYLRAP